MSSIPGATRRAQFYKTVALLSWALILLAPHAVQAQTAPLNYFKNYFVPGDYVVRGASLWRKGVNGKATVFIPPLGGADGVPARADIQAAFLYIQTAERFQGSGIDRAKFTGHNLGPFYAQGSTQPGSGTFAKALVSWATAPSPCWSVNYPGGRKLMTYRVDVLRFLPIDPQTEKHSLTAPLELVVPDAGRIFGDDDESASESDRTNLPRALGATIVVVYRDASRPFSGITIYDGAFKKGAFARMDQPIEGFYQASSVSPNAKMTPIVGDGRPFLSERVYLGGQLIATNPFVSALGPKWDSPTFSNLPLPGNADETVVTVDRHGLLSDCLTLSGWVFRSTVQDSDEDGLLDILESSAVPLHDPNNQPLPLLSQMGANPLRKTILAQVDFMETRPATSPDGLAGISYGGVLKPHHTHKPTIETLQLVVDTFANAPVLNPDGSTGIDVFFDIGANYQGWPFIIPANLARGGKAWDEMMTICAPEQFDPNDPRVCQFSNHTVNGEETGGFPGTLGWKTGFRLLRDDLRNGAPPSNVDCDAPGNDGSGQPCERQFDANRLQTFHYLFAAHWVGLPLESCQLPDGGDPDHQPDGRDLDCERNNPNFHRPKTNSAITDFHGADTLLTLGAFDDAEGRPVATPEQGASTITHEWGHNGGLKHGGPADMTVRNPDGTPVKNPDGTIQVIRQIPREPNGKPNYLSVMNWSFQLSLLPDVDGIGRIDLARDEIPPIPALNENLLAEVPLGSSLYRTRYYVPFTQAAADAGLKPATKHSDGTDLSPNELMMIRVEAPSVSGPIDWNADGNISGSVDQDVNFDGIPDQVLKAPISDWANFRLQELAGRRNVGGAYVDTFGRLAVGPMSLAVGSGDVGSGDVGSGDVGSGDVGSGDVGSGDVGSGDVGSGDVGSGDVGSGDVGSGDVGRGFFGLGDTDVGGNAEASAGGDELPREVAEAAEGGTPVGPPSGLRACLTSDLEMCITDPVDDPSATTPVNLAWGPPKLGPAQVLSYDIYRFAFAGTVPAPGDLPETPIATVGAAVTTYADSTAPGGTQLAYAVRARFAADQPIDGDMFTVADCEEDGGRVISDGTVCRFDTGPSNFAVVTTPEPPVAAPDLTIVNYTPASPPLSAPPGGTVTISAWRHLNQGTANANADGLISNGFYLSTDSVITTGDTRLDGNFNTNEVLPAGGFDDWGGPTLTIPSGTTPGAYYIGILVDEGADVAESDEGNNYVSEPIIVTSPAGAGSALNVAGTANLFNLIWGPGSNGIVVPGGLNYSTQPGVGWAQQYGGIFVTSYSLQAAGSDFLAATVPVAVRMTPPAGAIVEVWDLENLSVVATNISNPGSIAIFLAQPNRRYGGFAWYANNAQTSLALFAAYVP
jgi:hypothetical protein